MGELKSEMIDHRTAGLLPYAPQIASVNVKFTSFEPEQPTQVVVDRECVARRPLRSLRMVKGRGREYYDPAEEGPAAEKNGEERSTNQLT